MMFQVLGYGMEKEIMSLLSRNTQITSQDRTLLDYRVKSILIFNNIQVKLRNSTRKGVAIIKP